MSKVFLGDVAVERRETCKGSKDGYPIVGLEHLTPEEITLTAWNEDSENTFTKMFRKGDILFGRRRAYLKKAAVAPFDGICSGDITVIQAKPDRILPELLPFIIQNDALFDFAVGKSAGSLSPRVKWEYLKNYEFELPEMDKQRELAGLLWAMDATRKSYQRLITATDELVKSQFFGEFEAKRQSFNTCSLIAACKNDDDIKCGPFGTQLKQSEYTEEGIPVWGIPQVNAAFSIPADTYVSAEKALQLSTFLIQSDDIAMSRKGNIGQCALYPADYTPGIIASDVLRIRPDKTKLLPSFLMYQLHYSSNVVNQIEMVGNGQIMKGINVTKLKNITIYIPPMELQEQFAAFVRQSDKSKFELEQALSELTATYKRIITETFV